MDFKEFLKGIVSEEQVTSILDGMKENKFYISGNENVDERYNKLKTLPHALGQVHVHPRRVRLSLQPERSGTAANRELSAENIGPAYGVLSAI